MSLSDTQIRSLKPPEKGQKIYPDGTLPGFGVRISQGGAKVFILVHGKDRRKITIGRYPILSLSQARTEAKRLLAEFTLGRIRPQSITFPQAVELFCQDKARARRAGTVRQYKRCLGRLGFKGPLSEITHAEAARRVDRFKAPSERGHILVAGKVFFNWCIKRRYITENPLMGLSKPQSTPRARVLSDEELVLIWRACEQTGEQSLEAVILPSRKGEASPPPRLPAHFATIVKLLILTGQRAGEVARLRTDYFKDDLCTIPSEVTKNGREHTFPIGRLALSLLPSKADSSSPYLFPGQGASTFNNWSNSKAVLDKLCSVKGWTIHDLRRTFATRLAEMGVAPHVIERLLNHVTGTLSPIARVYNKAAYLPEMRAAIELWETRLHTLLKS